MRHIELESIAPDERFPGFKGRFVHSERMTLAIWAASAGGRVIEHSHPHEQIAHVLEGQFEFTVDGVTRTLGPGSIVVIPPGAVHSGTAITDCRILDAFCPVREDYR